MTQRIALVGFLFLAGCAAAANATLSTLASLASARADGVAMLVKVDGVKQLEYRAKAKIAKTTAEVDALEADFKAYTAKRDKALLGFDKMGNAIAALKDGVKAVVAGTQKKLDLAAVFGAYTELKTLLTDVGVKLPEVLP